MGWRETLSGAVTESAQNTSGRERVREVNPKPGGFDGFEDIERKAGTWKRTQAEPPEAVDAPRDRLAEGPTPTNEPPPAAPMAEPDHGPAGPLDGLPLLAADWRFLKRMARGRRRHALLLEYGRRWRQAAEAEPLPHRKANAGRLAANRWLLGASQ